ncbi:cyclin-dependent kinase 1 [Sphaceloma murrayae]|uniref:Cyclin-dependent kinase 1 n=1 Tax=Sphaceloma murrayae TaxID=2082308 RepID=A0A2K1QYC0_9PEZI|nr:cyclin-dependent kinase 1 [Sphaceloma murrayae]
MAPLLKSTLLRGDGTALPVEEVIAVGSNSFIIRHTKESVLKIARKESAENDNSIFKRLRGLPRIAEFHGFHQGGISLRFYPAGSLDKHVETLCAPPLQVRLRWMAEVMYIVRTCHNARVLLFDIALRNLVIDKKGSLRPLRPLRAIDFAQGSVIAADANIAEADGRGLTTKVDIFHMGCVLYLLSKWTRFETDRDNEQNWPVLEHLPDTKIIPWAPVIRACWTGKFRRVDDLIRLTRSSQARKRLGMAQ